MKRLHVIAILFAVVLTALTPIWGQNKRRATPIDSPATRTQSQNDARGDSARMLERKRARSVQYEGEDGKIVLVDTVTGLEWVDSTMLPKAPPMKYQLLHSINVGVNIWDPIMRVLGQTYGGADAYVNFGFHNRYFPTFEFGMGSANTTPSDNNYTYKTPLSPYFKLGADYNVLFNSDDKYQFFVGLRYGFSPFKYTVSNVHLTNEYWGETDGIDFDQASVTAGWFEIVGGLRVRIFSNVSAGWAFRYHSILHQSHPSVGDAWYIPGYGSSTSTLSGSFYFTYTLPFK